MEKDTEKLLCLAKKFAISRLIAEHLEEFDKIIKDEFKKLLELNEKERALFLSREE